MKLQRWLLCGTTHFFMTVIFGSGWNHLNELFWAQYLPNVLISGNLAGIMFSKYFSNLCQRKRAMSRISAKELFANTNSE